MEIKMEDRKTANLPTPKPSDASIMSLKRKVIKKTGIAKTSVDAAIRGYQHPLRKEENPSGLLLLELPQIAQEYGARKMLGDGVQKECVRLILTKFKNIGVFEIREAYRLKAAGHLKAPGAEMWGGEFNADQLGKVLSAYVEHRKKIIAEFLEEKQRAEESAETKRRRKEFDEKFPRMIEQAREEKKDWRDVPEYWYDAARIRGMFSFEPGEANAIFAEAKKLAKIEFQNEKEEAPIMQRAKLQAAALGVGDDFEFRAKRIARKITVLRKLILQK